MLYFQILYYQCSVFVRVSHNTEKKYYREILINLHKLSDARIKKEAQYANNPEQFRAIYVDKKTK